MVSMSLHNGVIMILKILLLLSIKMTTFFKLTYLTRKTFSILASEVQLQVENKLEVHIFWVS